MAAPAYVRLPDGPGKAVPFRVLHAVRPAGKGPPPGRVRGPEIGTFIHYLLENVAREVKTRGGWAAVQQPELRQLVREYTDRYAREEIDGYQEKSARFRYLFSRLRTAAYAIVEDMAGELAQSDFSPVAFELGFGGKDGQLPAVTITEGISACPSAVRWTG